MCPWHMDFSLCSGLVCDTGSQRSSCSTTVGFSVQGLLCTACLWVQHLGNLAKASCLAHHSPGCSSWECHPPVSSAGAAALVPRPAALSVSNCHTGGSPAWWLWQSPFPAEPQAAAACLRCVFMILKWRHPIQQAFPNALHAWEGLLVL